MYIRQLPQGSTSYSPSDGRSAHTSQDAIQGFRSRFPPRVCHCPAGWHVHGKNPFLEARQVEQTSGGDENTASR